MEGINWSDLFTAMDRFLLAIVDRNVLLVYVVLFAIFFSETGLVFMTFLPGDSLLFVAGAVAAQEAGLHVGVLMAVITVGAILGNTLNYYIGAWLGRKVYDGTLKWIDPVALKKTHDYYERHGGKTIVIARFLPIVRDNLGIILVVGIGVVLGPLALAAAWRVLRRLIGARPVVQTAGQPAGVRSSTEPH
jgi:membrane-associated protein